MSWKFIECFSTHELEVVNGFQIFFCFFLRLRVATDLGSQLV